MTMTEERNRKAAVMAAALACCALPAAAQPKAGESPAGYPGRPIRIIVSSAPGGGQDITTRPVARKLSDNLGVPVVVDNRGGGSGVIAMDIARQAPPDGYTLLVGATTMILTSVSGRVSYDVRAAYEPAVQMTNQRYFMVVHPSLPVATPREFVDHAKGRAGTLSYGTSGQGSLHFYGMEQLSERVGIRMVHVPYKGSGPALIDLLSGQIQVMFTSTISAAPHLRGGRLKALAYTGRQRTLLSPGTPTLSETIAPGFDLKNMYSLFAPAGTPKPVLALINRQVASIVNAGEVRERLAADGAEPAPPVSVDGFRKAYNREVAMWEKLVKARKLEK
ncbi:MAG: tripartite tricarboxylate transporter substrate binding protein [Burkholderiales bacterium]|nr:tripartite tricarboxylate transporter substrate binding protein [Burkholderiales bacterium]